MRRARGRQEWCEMARKKDWRKGVRVSEYVWVEGKACIGEEEEEEGVLTMDKDEAVLWGRGGRTRGEVERDVFMIVL